MKITKNKLLLIGFTIIANYSHSQNTFPSTGNVGIGIPTPAMSLHVKTPQTNLTSENIAQFEVSDAPGGLIKLTNGASANGTFYPMLDASSTVPFNSTQLPSLLIRANGLADGGSNPLMVFRSAINCRCG